jgi:hypothetical protein
VSALKRKSLGKLLEDIRERLSDLATERQREEKLREPGARSQESGEDQKH